MSNSNCRCTIGCPYISIFASIIIGIISGFLSFSAIITVTPAFLWVIFGIAVVYLAIALVLSAVSGGTENGCVCRAVVTFFTGVLGTILTSLILLAVAFAATSIIGAVITGLAIAFFALTILSVVCLIKCFVNCD